MVGLGHGREWPRGSQGGHASWCTTSPARHCRRWKPGRNRRTRAQGLRQARSPPRRVWSMVPAGEVTEQTLTALAAILGRRHHRRRRRQLLQGLHAAGGGAARGLSFVDCGTSGGIWGLREATASWRAGKGDCRTATGAKRSHRRKTRVGRVGPWAPATS
jgi:hypothetical protein